MARVPPASQSSRDDTLARRERWLVPGLVFVALVAAVIGSLGAPLITSVSGSYRVSLDTAQWTLTLPLLTGAIATPVLGRLGAGPLGRIAVLATLSVVVAGSLLTVLPLPFAVLLVGRGAQGTGLGLTALLMGVARDRLPASRAASSIAMIAVASTAGIGIGYPLAGLLTDLAGVRAAYAVGLVMTLLALLIGWAVVPPSPPGRPPRVDVLGAVVLGAGLLLLLLAISRTDLWRLHPAYAAGLLVLAGALLAGWVAVERRQRYPLVQLSSLRHGTVLGANATMLLGGAGMYLLLTLLTRYVQTPSSTGYGFGLSTFVAGLVLVPFSVLSFLAARLTPLLQRHIPAVLVLAASSAVVLGAFALLALGPASLPVPVLAMTILGMGAGSFTAAMPGVILLVTPPAETSVAMGVNQVVRTVGFAIGSALGGLVLSANTRAGQHFPTEGGYREASWLGAATMAATIAVILLMYRRRAAGR